MSGLAGLQVVQLGGGTAGPLLGNLLADQGADVVVIRSPNDLPTPLEDWDRGKSVVEGPPDDWVLRADVVIDGGAVASALVRPEACIWVSLTAGGLPPVDGLVGARTALYEVPLGRRPRFHPFRIASTVAASWAASGVMAALFARKRDGRGQAVRVDLQDAALASQELLCFFQDDPSHAFQPLRWVCSPFVALHPTQSGSLFVHLGLPAHLRSFLDGLGAEGDELAASLSDATLKDPGSIGSVRESVRARNALRRVLATASALEWEERFPDLCLGAVRTPDDWRDSPLAKRAGHVVDGPNGCTFGPAVECGAEPSLGHTSRVDQWNTPPAPTGDDRRPPLEGVRVVDASIVIAGPVVGRTLAELGATVLRIDDPWFRPAWAEAFYALFDRGKQGMWADLRIESEHRSTLEVVRDFEPDLLVQNFRPGVAERLGLLGVAPHTVSLSAFGNSESRPGWEQTAQAVCGVQSTYGEGTPELFPAPVHDLVTGLLGAFGALVALYAGGDAAASLARTSTWLQSDRLFGGQTVQNGWSQKPSWSFHQAGHQVQRVPASAAWTASASVKRVHRSDLGSFTVVDAPLHLSRTPTQEGRSRPRGWATPDWTRIHRPSGVSKPTPPVWWADRVRWVVGVLVGRATDRQEP